jgi:hypothetical protein
MVYQILPAADGYTRYNAARDQYIQTGIALVESSVTAAVAAFQAADTAIQAAVLLKADNLAGLADPSAARTALGLGGSATLAVGTGAGTVAAGNDSRITGALAASTASTTYAPLASPALTGSPTVNGVAVATTSAAAGAAAGLAIVFGV